MAVRLRLQRKGKKGKPYYHIVAADQRAPRDGKYLERIGAYNPTTVPATIELALDKAVNWLQKGAQPSETVRAILRYRGALYKNHLLRGVSKKALTEEEALKKFESWLKEKEKSIFDHSERISKAKKALKAKRLEAETKIKEGRLITKEEAEKAAEAPAENAKEKTENKDAEAATETSDAKQDNKAETTEPVKADAKVEEQPDKAETKAEVDTDAKAEDTKPAENQKDAADATPDKPAKAAEKDVEAKDDASKQTSQAEKTESKAKKEA